SAATRRRRWRGNTKTIVHITITTAKSKRIGRHLSSATASPPAAERGPFLTCALSSPDAAHGSRTTRPLRSSPPLDPRTTESPQQSRDDHGDSESNQGKSQTLQIIHGIVLPVSWKREQKCFSRCPLHRIPRCPLPSGARRARERVLHAGRVERRAPAALVV